MAVHVNMRDTDLAYLKKTSYLNIGFNNITDESVKYLLRLPLIELYLCNTFISDWAIKKLSITNIRYLSIYNCEGVTYKCIPYLNRMNLKFIHLPKKNKSLHL